MTKVLIDAPIETVRRSFNDPADIVQWDASADWRTVWASNDLRVDGLLQLRFETRRDGTRFDFAATYIKIEPLRLIEWWTDDERHVCVEFAETQAGVVVHQSFDAESNLSVHEQRHDWQVVLDNFARHVSANREFIAPMPHRVPRADEDATSAGHGPETAACAALRGGVRASRTDRRSDRSRP